MSSEINTNELNRIYDDGRLPTDSVEKEDEKVLDEVREGKKTTEELPQIIDPMRILDEVQYNEVYKLILGPCAAEGFSVNQKLLDLLKDKKIKPSELSSTLEDTMQEIVKYVNQNDAYPVMFSENGKIDVEETVQKAQRTNRKVSQYVTSLAEDSGKKVEELQTRETIFGLDIARQKSIEECAWLDQLFQVHAKEYRKDIDDILDSIGGINRGKNDKGEDVILTDLPQEVTVFLNIINRLDTSLAKIPDEIKERDKFALDMLRIYNYLNDSNLLSKLPVEEKDKYIQLIEKAKKMVERRFEEYPGGSIKDPQKINAILEDLHLDESEIKDIKQTEIFAEVQSDLKELSINDVELDVTKQREKINIDTVMSICSISDYSMHMFDTDNSKIVERNSIINKRIMAVVSSLNPEYAEEAREKARSDGYALVRLNALREIEAEALFLSHEEDHVQPEKDGVMKTSVYDKLRVAVGVLNLPDFSEDLRKLAISTIKEFLPEIEITPEIEKALLENNDSAIINEISTKVQQEAMLKKFAGENKANILSGKDFAFSGISMLDAKTKGKMINAMVTSEREGTDLQIDVLESEKYKKLVEDGIAKYDYKFFTTEKLGYFVREIKSYAGIVDEKQYRREKRLDVDVEDKIDKDEILFVKKLVEAAKLLKDRKPGEIDRLVKEYLIDYLPKAFDKEGNINLDGIDDCFLDFLSSNGYSGNKANELIDKMEKEINAGFDARLEKYKINTDIVQKAMQAEEGIRRGLGLETSLEQIEDTAMFVNYILSKKDSLSPESQKELEGYVENIQERLDREHEIALSVAEKGKVELIGNHKNYDKNRVKSKFFYLEKEARKLVATERINEAEDRFIRAHTIGMDQKEEIQGILGTYMGILNDYKNEELKVDDYNTLMKKLSKLMRKIDPKLIDEDGRIDEDKVLEKYNEVNETDFSSVDSAAKYEEMELLMRYTRRLSKGTGEKQLLYRSVIKDKDLYINSKIHEKLQEDVHFNTETTNRLITDVWKSVSADSIEKLSKDETVQYVKNLALVVGMYRQKDLNKKGLSYEAGIDQELKRKTLGIAKMKLAEIFPEIQREEDTFDISKLDKSLREYLLKNDPSLKEKIKNSKDKEILDILVQDKTETMIQAFGPMEKPKTAEELLAEANAILKGSEKEKTYEDNVLVAAMTVKMLGEIGKPEMADRLLKRLTRQMSETEKNNFINDCNNKTVDEKMANAMRRVAGLINIEKYNEQLELAADEKSKVSMHQDDIADYLQVAVGALYSCRDLPKTEINLSAQKEITDFIKNLAPDAVNSKGKVDYKKLMNVVNDLRAQRPNRDGSYEVITSKEEFIQASVRKTNVRLGVELYRGRIDSRFTNKYFVPTSAKTQSEQSISKSEMDEIMEARGEEIVVATEQTRVAQEDRKQADEVLISGSELDKKFRENAVEIGGAENIVGESAPKTVVEAEPAKVEQKVEMPPQGVHVENVEMAEDWKENLPVEQKKKGFFANILDKVKTVVGEGIKNVKDKLFGSNSSSSTSNNTTSDTTSTSSSGGVNKDEQNIEALTGHGKIQLTFGSPTNQTQGDNSKSKDPKGDGEIEQDEEVL